MNKMSVSRTVVSRRSLLSLLVIGTAVTAVGCDDAASRDAVFLERVQEQVKAVKDAADALESDVGEFETQNWRDVVPHVQSSLADLQAAIEDLEQMLEPPDVG